MKTTVILYSIFVLHAFTFEVFSQTIQRAIGYTALKANNGQAIEGFENFDKDKTDLTLTFTIRMIDDDVEEATINIVNAANAREKLVGRKVNLASNSYDLEFDLTSAAKDIEGTKEFHIVEGESFLAKFNLTPSPSADETQPCAQQTVFQREAQDFVSAEVVRLRLKKKDGMLVDRQEEVVHLFIDQYGKFYGRGFPTTATPDYRFQLHLITSVCDAANYSFIFSYTGTYEEDFNINNTFESTRVGVTPTSAGISFILLDYPEIGPFTSNVTMKVERQDGSSRATTILDGRIPIAKKYHVTISAGLFATSLRNPVDIEKGVATSGDSTLFASDNINSRGVITVMATFYPTGRSFLLPPRGGLLSATRLGIIVGTQIGSRFKENFFAGFSIDVARGLSIAGGVHYGRRNYLPGYDDFDFGKDAFSGPLTVKQQWSAGIFLGCIVDGRVLGYLFPGLADN